VRTTSGWPRAPIPRSPSTRASRCSSCRWTHRASGRAMHLMGTHNINYTFYEDVRVPAANLVGGENNGWTLITNQLNHERSPCARRASSTAPSPTCGVGAVDQAARRAPVIDQQWVQSTSPGCARARIPAPHQLEGCLAGHPGPSRRADASSIKVFGTEFYLRPSAAHGGHRTGAYLQRDSPGAVLAGASRCTPLDDHPHLWWGTNEIQRDLIAIFGLGMPRSLR